MRNARVQGVEGVDNLEQGWSRLGADGARLRGATMEQLARYLHAYADIREVWWGTMLGRRVSRSAFRRFMGKQSVMDAFWAEVRRDAQRLLDRMQQLTGIERVRLAVSYGTAVNTLYFLRMRGQRAVPSTAMMHSCAAAFIGCVFLFWEAYTSQYDVNTLQRLWAVAERHTSRLDADGVAHPIRKLEPVPGRSMPSVRAEDAELHATAMAQRAEKELRRRQGGRRPILPPRMEQQQPGHGQGQRSQKCKENRGQRWHRLFCHLLGRDAASAQAIAELLVCAMLGFVRLYTFTHGEGSA